jgi:hypothetical protein
MGAGATALALALAFGAGCASTAQRPPRLVLADAVPPPPPPEIAATPGETAPAPAPEPMAPGPWSEPLPSPGEETDAESRLQTRRALRITGWISLGFAAESLAVAIPTSFYIQHKKNILDADCNAQKQCSQDGINVATSLPELTKINTISWALAIVGAGAGAVLVFVTRPKEGSAAQPVTVAVSPGGVSGRF